MPAQSADNGLRFDPCLRNFFPMKILPVALAALLVLSLSARAQAPVGPGAVKLGKIEPAFVTTPEIQYTGGPQKRTGRAQKWLEIEVAYETKPESIDELTFKYSVIFDKQLINGEVTYANISKGEHFAVMYVTPKGLEKLTKGKGPNANSVENVFVEINRQGQKLDGAGFKQGNLPNMPQLTGFLFNKNQTPFAPLFYDRYEEIKSAR